ncbi:TOX high mobility group box family member 4-A-like isoform X3 [Harmonia axyridis]|uniref:TOX high mobility group box family member 4-A-like isoform X3 n=1 Tax=Harmonia axyridis TaxID=115357 RepID=UPI001E27817D|nr:TOX high mobility group box family member 4-A-like isoform X3 [Harmonia axyridis]
MVFHQFQRSENVDLSLSIPQSNFQSNGYEMNDQTFHTPSFGDEEFDIPAINPQQQQAQQQQQQQNHHGHQNHPDQQQHYQPPMQSMQQMSQQNQQQDAMGMHDPTGGYQQPLYLSGPDHGMVNPSYHSPQSNYSLSQQQQQHNNQLLMIQQQQQQHQQMMMSHGQPPPGSMGGYGASPQHPQGRGNSPPAAPGQEHTTSDDSDDSTPHPAMVRCPIVMNPMKRPSPEPADQTITKAQKKPKVQKKKKKRDPNEPQKPVSAYALFFRDTQAAIKGQNPNASFGEVSKIVASMWDALDSEHKNVYKKKTEAAKKEYLKALAAYRASLVSKGAGEGDGMYGNYSNYTPNNPQYGGYNPQGRAVPSPPMSQAQTPPSNQQGGPMGKKPQGMMGPGGPMNPGQQGPHPGMMQSPMGHMGMGHMQQPPHNSYMQQPHPSQHMPVSPQQHVPHSPQQHVPVSPHMQHMSPPPMVSSSPPVSAPSPAIPTSVAQQQSMAAQVAAHQQQQAAAAHHQAQQGQMGPGQRPNSCIRNGCPNPAITNPEWEDEYCSNECVVSHCRDVFTNWVVSNKNQSQNFSTVK